MSLYVNLMSEQARMRQLRHERLQQWSRIVLAEIAMLLPLAAYVWLPAFQENQQLAALQSQYEPIRQLIATNKSIREKIELVREKDRLTLALSNSVPVVTLMGLLGQAVNQLQGQVYINGLELQQDRHPWKENGQKSVVLTLQGLGADSGAARQFAEALQEVLPYASVQLTSSDTITVGGQPRLSFAMKGSF